MKLLLCIHCHDVKRLTAEHQECACGAAWANLIPWNEKDNHVACNHNALIIGMDDAQLKQALERKTIDPKGSQRVPAFFLPEPCKSVHRLTESEDTTLDRSNQSSKARHRGSASRKEQNPRSHSLA